MTISHAAQSGAHAHAERGVDFYPTPPEATAALLTVERLPRRLWDCGAGGGGIVRPLREAGHIVIATDLIERDFKMG